jgi:hypothetical protein
MPAQSRLRRTPPASATRTLPICLAPALDRYRHKRGHEADDDHEKRHRADPDRAGHTAWAPVDDHRLRGGADQARASGAWRLT